MQAILIRKTESIKQSKAKQAKTQQVIIKIKYNLRILNYLSLSHSKVYYFILFTVYRVYTSKHVIITKVLTISLVILNKVPTYILPIS